MQASGSPSIAPQSEQAAQPARLERIPVSTLERIVVGTGLSPGTFADQLGSDPCLLVFLRHFGCVFCRETIAELRAASEADPAYPGVLLFFQGSPTEARALLRTYWPSARAVSDPQLEFYRDFGLERGSLWQTLGPGPIAAQRRARRKGHEQGQRSGDVWQMPGAFVAHGERIVWSHEYRHAGDLPDFAAIPKLAGVR